MSAAECLRFQKKLAFHTAPSLLGIKCANLISVKKSDFHVQEQIASFNQKTARKNLKMRILCHYPDRVLIFIYSEKLLGKQLAQCKSILMKYGYPKHLTIENALVRLSEHMQNSRDSHEFPHEIGIFLGYPIEDVLGFIENHGENYVFSGYWKVYGNPEQARRTFSNYDKCRTFLCEKLNQGCSIYQALKIN
ncbi:MAG: DUF3793 family protein [Oscillospiraceae bacterium]|nr:DUF3793 family protein [Oscillospiraceae bacterium]